MEKMKTVYRITVYADGSLEDRLVARFLKLGAKGYTAVNGRGSGQRQIVENVFGRAEVSRIEILAHKDVAQRIVDYLNHEMIGRQPVTVCLEEVRVIRDGHF
jgi:hypothetical protein